MPLQPDYLFCISKWGCCIYVVIYVWVQIGVWSGPKGGGEKEGGNDRENIKWFWLVNCLLCPVRTIGGEVRVEDAQARVVLLLFSSLPTH